MLARQDGEARLAALKQGEDKLAWGGAKSVSRMDNRALPAPAVPALFRLDAGKLPVYAGVELPGSGYTLFRLNKVEAGDKLDPVRQQALLAQLGNLAAQEEVQLYLAALRQRHKVEINNAALEAKEK